MKTLFHCGQSTFGLLDVQYLLQTMPCGHRNSNSSRWVRECLDLSDLFFCGGSASASASALRSKAALALAPVKRKRTLILAELLSLSRPRNASNQYALKLPSSL